MRKSILVAIAACGLAACGESGSEAAAESMAGAIMGQDVELEDDGETVTIGGTRMSSGASARVPDDFPSDVYLPGDYTLETVVSNETSTSLHMSTDAAADALFADAVEAMTGAGWTQGWTIPPEDGVGLAAFEKDDRRASISVDDRAEEDTLYMVETGIQQQ